MSTSLGVFRHEVARTDLPRRNLNEKTSAYMIVRGASCKGVFRISSTSLSHVVQSILPLGAMAFFRTARQTSLGIRHLSLKVKLSHSLGKLVSATFSVLNLGPLRNYKARSFSNRLLRRGTDLHTVYA